MKLKNMSIVAALFFAVNTFASSTQPQSSVSCDSISFSNLHQSGHVSIRYQGHFNTETINSLPLEGYINNEGTSRTVRMMATVKKADLFNTYETSSWSMAGHYAQKIKVYAVNLDLNSDQPIDYVVNGCIPQPTKHKNVYVFCKEIVSTKQY